MQARPTRHPDDAGGPAVTSPYQGRRDPQPITQGWEIAVVVLGGAVLGLGLAALAGLGAASAVFGGGWVWPHGTDTISHVLGGLLGGRPGRGLPAPLAARLPADGYVYGCVALCEAALVALTMTAAVLVVRYRRPGDARGGMATRGEARSVLGVRRLRAATDIIRPDLTGNHAHHNRARDNDTTSRTTEPAR
jgi:hypothetical protein